MKYYGIVKCKIFDSIIDDYGVDDNFIEVYIWKVVNILHLTNCFYFF